MSFKKAADGITAKGKTKGKNLGDSGPTSAAVKEVKPKGNAGKSNSDMLKMGRGLAKIAAQKRG